MSKNNLYETRIKPKIKFIPSLIENGFSMDDIAEMLGVSRDSLYKYKDIYKEFSDSFKKRDEIGKRVENTFIKRLTGEYRTTREVYKKDNNKDSPTYGQMVLELIEKYELPLSEGAYKFYLSTIMPLKYKEGLTESKDEDNIITVKIVSAEDEERIKQLDREIKNGN